MTIEAPQGAKVKRECSSPPHHYIVESSGLKQSPGTCKKCGFTRMFETGIDLGPEAYRLMQDMTFRYKKERAEEDEEVEG